MKITITHPKVYGTNGKVMELGLQEVDDKIAKKLIARGVAFGEAEVEPEPEKEKQPKK
tara:strand:+ start:582 stop:755 length:174 start_codon:yes stop_codon:yes gene_type:complete